MGILIFISWIGFSILVGAFAASRGRPGSWVFVALLISPLIAFISLAILPDLAEEKKREEQRLAVQQQAKKVEQRRAEEARRIHGADFVVQIDKLRQLRDRQIISDIEFAARKSKLITELSAGVLVESAEEFLSLLIPLVDNGSLTPDELGRLKSFALGDSQLQPRRLAATAQGGPGSEPCPGCGRPLKPNAKKCEHCWWVSTEVA